MVSCRLCGESHASGVLLYEDNPESVMLLLYISYCFPKEVLEINKSDQLSKSVCHICRNRVKQVHIFFQLTRKTQDKLKSELQSNKVEATEDDDRSNERSKKLVSSSCLNKSSLSPETSVSTCRIEESNEEKRCLQAIEKSSVVQETNRDPSLCITSQQGKTQERMLQNEHLLVEFQSGSNARSEEETVTESVDALNQFLETAQYQRQEASNSSFAFNSNLNAAGNQFNSSLKAHEHALSRFQSTTDSSNMQHSFQSPTTFASMHNTFETNSSNLQFGPESTNSLDLQNQYNYSSTNHQAPFETTSSFKNPFDVATTPSDVSVKEKPSNVVMETEPQPTKSKSEACIELILGREGTDEYKYNCSNCKCVLNTSKDFKKHMKDVHNNAPFTYSCSVCKKKLVKKETLLVHMKTHRKQKLSCTHCGETFSFESRLCRHLNRHMKIMCDICHKVFKDKFVLNRHRLTHTGLKPFICTYCGEGFTQRSALKDHLLTHTDQKPHVCRLCSKAFRHKVSLKNHILNSHRNWDIQNCRECQSKNGSLCERHIRLDNLEDIEKIGRYTCDKCDKRFSSKYRLERHYRQHTGDKPFSCNLCGSKFSQAANLVAHQKSHMKSAMMFKCSVCGFYSQDETTFQNHICAQKMKQPMKSMNIAEPPHTDWVNCQAPASGWTEQPVDWSQQTDWSAYPQENWNAGGEWPATQQWAPDTSVILDNEAYPPCYQMYEEPVLLRNNGENLNHDLLQLASAVSLSCGGMGDMVENTNPQPDYTLPYVMPQ